MLYEPILGLDMKLADQLKKLIKQNGTTVTNLSRATKVPAQTIHNWLSGAKPKDFDKTKKVADHFEVTLDFLVYGIESEKKSHNFDDYRDEINAGNFEVILRRIKSK